MCANHYTAPQVYGQNQINRFRKAVTSNNKQQIQKYLLSGKLSQLDLSQALFLCIQNYRVDQQSDQCLFLLLRAIKCNPNLEINNQTPLIAACKQPHATIIRYLIQQGAKPDLCNSLGQHPLQFLLDSRRENYDSVEQLISAMNNVNIEMIGSTPILLAIQNQFPRIFKALLDKGAYLYVNDETILHIIMKKTFKNISKKKKMIKQLFGKSLQTHKDKNGKLPEDYETSEIIKQYYFQIFKPKVKPLEKVDKEAKDKMKESKQIHSEWKEGKKKNKDEDATFDEIQDLEENYQNSQVIVIDIDKKIIEVEEDDEQKKIQEAAYKNKRKSISINLLYKKTPKPLTNIVVDMNPKGKKNIKKSTPTVMKKKSNVGKKQDQIEGDEEAITKKIDKKIQKKQQKKEIDKKEDKKQLKEIQKKEVQKKQGQKVKIQRGQLKQIEKKIQQRSQNKEEDGSCELQKFINVKPITELQQSKDIQLLKVIQEEQFNNQEDLSSEESSQSSDEDQKPLVEQLTEDIFNLVDQIDNNLSLSQDQITKVINLVRTKIQNVLIDKTQNQNDKSLLQVVLYGSQAYKLAVETSDINLLICTELSPHQLIRKIQASDAFIDKDISDIKFLTSNAYSMIKMLYKNHKVNMSFQIRGHSGVRCSQLIRQFMIAEPLLRPLVLTLKTLIKSYDLQDVESGGLGSYSLTLMAIAVLQSTNLPKERSNVGRLFMQFLLFYGYQMDYVCQAVIIHPPGFAEKPVYNIYQLPYTIDLNPKLIIYDPLNPVNNVGVCTYRVIALKRLYVVWYNRLHLSECRLKDLTDLSFSQLLSDQI